ncbi:hypothetical protein [Bradyrhizobium sp. S69]|uniref:hypothetical protein n=1 Tax=Bradyrhizobium sp. S69 TaxID=1641856 RepID=UPI00131BFEAB|nr:hypothetical protein [Bradyrhizobium sp. S69]
MRETRLGLKGDEDGVTGKHRLNIVMPGQKREARLRTRCPGHPRLGLIQKQKDVDARVKPGHDG